MVTRHFIALSLWCAACSAPGRHYELVITPTARAQAEATELAVSLVLRSGGIASTRLTLPHPTPRVPWIVDLDTRDWGGAAFSVDVAARASADIARGSGGPVGNQIFVSLIDVVPGLDMAAPPDGAVDLAGLPDLSGQTCSMLTVIAIADTYVTSAAPANVGGYSTIDFVNGNTVTLLRFNVNPVPTGATITSATLTLHYAATSQSGFCTGPGATCHSCAGQDQAGAINVRYLRNDWDEATASWNNRSGGYAWVQPGASGIGTGDCSAAIVGSATHTADTDTTIAANASGLSLFWGFVRAGQIDFRLEQSSGGSLVIASRRNSVDNCASGGSYGVPTLTLQYCVPTD